MWQRQWLQGAVLEQQLAYWRAALAGARRRSSCRPIGPRPPRGELSRRAASAFDASAEPLTRALKELGRREGATLFMTLLAAYQVLLCRYSGQDDIAVGMPIAGRNRAASSRG